MRNPREMFLPYSFAIENEYFQSPDAIAVLSRSEVLEWSSMLGHLICTLQMYLVQLVLLNISGIHLTFNGHIYQWFQSSMFEKTLEFNIMLSDQMKNHKMLKFYQKT